ncbi:tyrosine-type recombinase/integrase [Rhodoplanes sp. Z2-YC6860]|uniref:tyrosine-type recombinase/integrase n=1 Tax=Rhodoplanes sp. Z2-YC6860 TaxID=674703 RepID=UPI00078CAEFB|nr:tyrosine-type recombinase/integrase [Rhodoplanes sp. Z2-YC6860]AMN40186.1 phage integrase family protein [Rhodoplanes sp. Z2-YC6860]
MARRTRSALLENRTNRLKLALRKKPYTALIAPGIFLAYRRNAGPGTWSVKAHGWLKRFALADDHEEANGESVMSYWQALEQAKRLARAGEINSDTPITVGQAVNDYELDLEMRGASRHNASNVRIHLGLLATKTVALLTERELRDWRTALIAKNLKPASADRVARSLKAALSLASRNDHQRITNDRVWRNGLKRLPDTEVARNVVLPDQTVIALVHGAHEDNRALGLLIEVLAETGARESQVLRLRVEDLLDKNPAEPRLLMPRSRKGRIRKVEHRPLPISTRLASLLRENAKGRDQHDRLIDPIYKVSDKFRVVTKRLGLSAEITPYALRHSSIARQLLKGKATALVASNHDTSIKMIEQHYGRYITGDPSDALTRETLLDFDKPPTMERVA